MTPQETLQAGAFELTGISGVSLARGADVIGIRLVYLDQSLGIFDGKYLPFSISAPPIQAPDLSYVRFEWQVPVTAEGIRRFAGRPRLSVNSPSVIAYKPGEAATVALEWSFDGETVRGRYSSDCAARFALVVNGCFQPGKVIVATAKECGLIQGQSTLCVRLRGDVEEPIRFDDMLELQHAWANIRPVSGNAMAAYPVTLGEPLFFTLSLGSCPLPDDGAHFEQAADLYEKNRMRSSGEFEGAAEAVASLSGYSRTYDPRRQILQTTVNRTWGGVNQPGLVFGWDNFFTSYISAWEDPKLAAASLEHIVGVYGENGIEHGPVQRNLIMIYCRTIQVLGDMELARRTWATMMAFMRFWFPHRDGNGDGLIESGASADPTKMEPGRLIQEAMDETGYDEIPIYSAGFSDGRRGLLAPGVRFDWSSRCLTVTLVCQNSLYITACRSMAALARRIGRVSDAEWLDAERERVADQMRRQLFCEDEGVFRDRFWEGGFSPVKAMTTFFPLLAGIADEPVKTKLLATLLDPEQFWGENLIPTVSRKDSAYCDGLDGKGNYWRGNCWPPTTYMVYLAAKEAGWDDTVARYGQRTWAQFMKYWRAHTHAYENYPPEGDVDHEFPYVQMWGGREVRYTWSAMMLFCGLEELFAPEIDGSLRFGNPHLAVQSTWKGFLYQGRRVEAEAGPDHVRVAIEGAWEFYAEPGIAVRNCVVEQGRIGFRADSPVGARIKIRRSSLAPGTAVRINGEAVEAECASGEMAFAVPAGSSAVAIE